MTNIPTVIAATWPPEEFIPHGPFHIARSGGGGNRLRAARLASGATATRADIQAAARVMTSLGQPQSFMVFGGQEALDRELEALGYAGHDETYALVADVAEVAAPPPPVTCFSIWPPLAVQEEIWEAGGIGPARRAAMARAKGPKTSLFGRMDDRPAGSAFVAIADGTAMLHALEVDSARRRKGLAAHMMRAAAHWANENGANRISVLVTRENLPARGLYASLGFENVGQYHYRTAPPGMTAP